MPAKEALKKTKSKKKVFEKKNQINKDSVFFTFYFYQTLKPKNLSQNFPLKK